MYKSPIEIFRKEMELQCEEAVCRAVQEIGIVVDKDELLRALRYDRGQYDKGWRDFKSGI